MKYVCIIVAWVVTAWVVGLVFHTTKDPNYLWAMFIPVFATSTLLGQNLINIKLS